MKTRPWPIVILAALHIFAPLGNLLFNAIIQNVNPLVYANTVWRIGSAWNLAEFFILLPAAGVAIYLCKKWSYPIFIAITLWMTYSNYTTWVQTRFIFSGPVLISALLVDIILVGYFLLPAVRRTYIDPRVRWWESKPRYQIDIPVALRTAGEAPDEVTATLRDISEGGAFVAFPGELLQKLSVHLSFRAMDLPIDLDGTLVYRRRSDELGYGVQFVHTPESRDAVRALIRKLKKSGVPARGAVDLKQDFVEWLTRFVKTGKGWMPEPPTPR